MIAQISPMSTSTPQRLYPMFIIFVAPAHRQCFILPGNRSRPTRRRCPLERALPRRDKNVAYKQQGQLGGLERGRSDMERRAFLGAGIALTGAFAVRPLRAQPGNSSRAAVVIGVDKPGNLPKLRAAGSGARTIAEWLKTEG